MLALFMIWVVMRFTQYVYIQWSFYFRYVLDQEILVEMEWDFNAGKYVFVSIQNGYYTSYNS